MRPVGQAGELQVRPPDQARQSNALLQMPIRVREPERPDLGDTEADQRRGTQILAQPEVRGIGTLGESEHPMCLLGHDREIDETPGQEEPQHRQHDLHPSATLCGHGRQRAGGHGQVPPGIFQGSPDQITGHLHGGELGAGRDDPAGERGQQFDQRCSPPGEVEVEPVVRQQPGRRPPVPGGLRLADRLDRVPVLGQPPGGSAVQRGLLIRLGAAQFQLQQVREQLVVAEPRPARVQRHHERVGLLQILQDPFPA